MVGIRKAVHVYVSRQERKLLVAAAKREKRSLSSFCLLASLEKAAATRETPTAHEKVKPELEQP